MNGQKQSKYSTIYVIVQCQVCSFATLRSIKIAVFSNFWRALLLIEMQNIARNGKKSDSSSL